MKSWFFFVILCPCFHFKMKKKHIFCYSFLKLMTLSTPYVLYLHLQSLQHRNSKAKTTKKEITKFMVSCSNTYPCFSFIRSINLKTMKTWPRWEADDKQIKKSQKCYLFVNWWWPMKVLRAFISSMGVRCKRHRSK